jgi:hypothetical protein
MSWEAVGDAPVMLAVLCGSTGTALDPAGAARLADERPICYLLLLALALRHHARMEKGAPALGEAVLAGAALLIEAGLDWRNRSSP